MDTDTRSGTFPRVSRFWDAIPDFEYTPDGRPIKPTKDPAKSAELIAQRVREKQIAIATIKAVRGELRACYNREGVNHREKCKHLATEYLERIRAPDYGAHLAQVRYWMRGRQTAHHQAGQ